MDNRLKLYDTAKTCLNLDMAPYEDDLGCAEALNNVFKKAFGRDIGGGTSTYRLYEVLRFDTRFIQITNPLPGDIIISPTGYGNRKKLRNGHTGIVGENEQIMSNTSANGLWLINYTLTTWKRRYKDYGGYPMEYFRVKTPELAPMAPTINPVSIAINPPLTTPPPMPAWMENLIFRTKQTFGFGLTFGAARSPRWREIRRVHLMQFPACAVCGKKGKLFKANEVHHIIPVHIDKSKEENFDNFITLCKTHHLDFGHLGSFHSFNEAVAEDATLWKKKRQERP